MSTATKRVLPADVYDALEMSALAYGGIGAGAWSTPRSIGFGNEPQDIPVCVTGHARACDPLGRVYGQLIKADIGVIVNDEAVSGINARRKRPRNARVSFAAWCRALNVERGS